MAATRPQASSGRSEANPHEHHRSEGSGRTSHIPSCEGCKIRKTRCDRAQPTCGACAVRNVACKPGVPKERHQSGSAKPSAPARSQSPAPKAAPTGAATIVTTSAPVTSVVMPKASPPKSIITTPTTHSSAVPEALLRAFRGLHLKGRINRASTLQTLQGWKAQSQNMTEFSWTIYQSIFLAVNVQPGELENCVNANPGCLLAKAVIEEAKDADIRFFPTFRALDDGETPMLIFYYTGTELRLTTNKAFDSTYTPVVKSNIRHTSFALCSYLSSLVAPEDADDIVNAMASFLFEGSSSLSQVLKFHDKNGVEVVASFRLRIAALPELEARIGVITITPLPLSRYVVHPLLTAHTSLPAAKRAKRSCEQGTEICNGLGSSTSKPGTLQSRQQRPPPVVTMNAMHMALSPSAQAFSPGGPPCPLPLTGPPMDLWSGIVIGPNTARAAAAASTSESAFFMPTNSTGCFTAWTPSSLWSTGSATVGGPSEMQQDHVQSQQQQPHQQQQQQQQQQQHAAASATPPLVQQSPILSPTVAAIASSLTEMLTEPPTGQGSRWALLQQQHQMIAGGQARGSSPSRPSQPGPSSLYQQQDAGCGSSTVKPDATTVGSAMPLPPCWIREPQSSAGSSCGGSSSATASTACSTDRGPYGKSIHDEEHEEKALWLLSDSIFSSD